MAPYIMTLTQGGLAAIVNVQSGTIGPVSITQIGLTDATFTVASTLDALPGEIKRVAVAGDTLGDDLIHVTALDDSADAYGYRGFALYTSTGLLFAVYGQADRIAEKTSGTVSYLALDIAMARGQADAISFGNTDFLNPPATTEQQGVVELATNAEASAGTDALRALTPAAMQAALLVQLLRVHGAGSGINADLLDGQHGAWYADIAARLGYVPFDSAGFTGAAVKSVLGYVPLDAAAFTKAAILALLTYTPQDAADFSFGSNDNGYWRKMPDGVIEQWGEVTAGESGSPPSLNFPIPFTDLASVNLSVTARAPNTGATNGNKVGGNKVSLTQFNVFSDDLDMAVFWRAIGR